MAINIEIKARISCEQTELVRATALAHSSSAPEVLWQRDTFYRVPCGRLKLREFQDGTAELIAYERRDLAGPKFHRISAVRAPIPSRFTKPLLEASVFAG